MERFSCSPRVDWREKVEKLGFTFHSLNDLYWDESVYYVLNNEDVELIEEATENLWSCCLEAVDYIISEKLYDNFGINSNFIAYIERSWERKDPSVYGRFDFTFENGIPKLLEFNADTPTSLFESSVVQWFWLEDFAPHKDQFNSIHEKLIDRWKELSNLGVSHFTCVKENTEDLITTEYLRDTAEQAGIISSFVFIEDIGWNQLKQCFVDLDDRDINCLFKLYPYEWLFEEGFADGILQTENYTKLIEPAWKSLLSNKAILPVLWKLFPNHKNLLPSYFERDRNLVGNDFVRKPIFSREGANITLQKKDTIIEQTFGEYGKEGFIYQKLCPLPNYNGNYPLVGSWIIGDEPAGVGIRESNSLITDNLSRFVPHIYDSEK
jgi:glutathionylspermidine synthase